MEYRTIQKKTKTDQYSIFNIQYSIFGQSLFEVVIAIGVAALILVGAVSLSTFSLRNTDFSKNNALATKYAQEGSEYIRQKRDEGWDMYMTNYTGSGIIYLNSTFANLSTPLIDGVFARTVTTVCNFYDSTTGTTTNGVVCGAGSTANIVDSTVSVSWTDGQGTHKVDNITTLTKWRDW